MTRWSRRAKTAQALALRSKIVLACADGLSNAEVAGQLRAMPGTVTRWRGRFVGKGLEGLVDELWPGRPASILLDQVEDVLIATLEQTPPLTSPGADRMIASAEVEYLQDNRERLIQQGVDRGYSTPEGVTESVDCMIADARARAGNG